MRNSIHFFFLYLFRPERWRRYQSRHGDSALDSECVVGCQSRDCIVRPSRVEKNGLLGPLRPDSVRRQNLEPTSAQTGFFHKPTCQQVFVKITLLPKKELPRRRLDVVFLLTAQWIVGDAGGSEHVHEGKAFPPPPSPPPVLSPLLLVS